MSHNVQIDSIKINDIEALQAAAQELRDKGVNIQIEINAYARSYGSSTSMGGNYPVVIKLPDSPYDIGLQQQADGTYSPVFDPYAGHIKKHIGVQDGLGELVGAACSPHDPRVHIGRLMQMYGVCKAEREAGQNGLVTQRNYDEQTKQYNLVVTGY